MSKKKKAAERESGRASAQNAVRATLARVVRNEIGNQKSVQAKTQSVGRLHGKHHRRRKTTTAKPVALLIRTAEKWIWPANLLMDENRAETEILSVNSEREIPPAEKIDRI
jgi:hypothetical protein